MQCAMLGTFWSDVGTWAQWSACADADPQGNVQRGNAIVRNSANSVVYSSSPLTCAVGVEDLVIVNTGDVCLVSKKNEDLEDRREILRQVAEKSSLLLRETPRTVRPWGSFEILMRTRGFQVKRLVIAPGQRLSLQRHRHRSEHWVVTSGKALVTLDSTQRQLAVGQSIDILKGQVHRLENPSESEQLQVIEVQLGEQILESDIERLSDDHGR